MGTGPEAAEQIAQKVKDMFAEAVRINSQTLTEPQQAQARTNIGAAKKATVVGETLIL